MKRARIRFLIVLFAAMFLANNAVAATRACMVVLAAHEHAAIQVLDTDDDERLCPETKITTHYLVNCTQIFKSDERNFSFDAPAAAIAPPPPPQRVWFPTEPGSLALALAQPVLGPPLTILFGNLRN